MRYTAKQLASFVDQAADAGAGWGHQAWNNRMDDDGDGVPNPSRARLLDIMFDGESIFTGDPRGDGEPADRGAIPREILDAMVHAAQVAIREAWTEDLRFRETRFKRGRTARGTAGGKVGMLAAAVQRLVR